MSFDLQQLVRTNIRQLKPYASARHEFEGEASVYLDANENSLGSPLQEAFNRYPDPLQWQLKFALAKIKGVPAENIFIGNGSDEVIDLALRIFCEPGRDNIIICPPTYGMYEVSAGINAVEVRKAGLTAGFQLNLSTIMNLVDAQTKIIFVCSPNNPTGNNMHREDIEWLLNNFNGILVVDEAYINFSRQKTCIQELTTYPSLIVMQTLSKAWGLAALRLGLCFASLGIIDLFNKVKPPYNINKASAALGLEALAQVSWVNEAIQQTVAARNSLASRLEQYAFVTKVFESEANFLLVQVTDANGLYHFLTGKGIIVRNRSREPGCENCLRITIGTPQENEILLAAFDNWQQAPPAQQ